MEKPYFAAAMNYTLPLSRHRRIDVPLVGGKGANLSELSRIVGINVPDGFCITTEAYIESTHIPDDLADEIAARLAK